VKPLKKNAPTDESAEAPCLYRIPVLGLAATQIEHRTDMRLLQ
jgi:hypothetical protein